MGRRLDMKKRINLLYKKKDYQNIERIFINLRRLTFALGAVSVLLLLIIFVLKTGAKSKHEEKLSIKQQYFTQLLAKKDIETKAIYFNEKSTVLKSYLKDDINFLPYYQQLQTYLPVSTDYTSIELINFDNERNAEIVLSFSNYDDFYQHLSRFENEQFLGIFENLMIDSFTLSEEKSQSYQLKLIGKFKPLVDGAKN